MKKVKKFAAIAASAFISGCFIAGCAKAVSVNTSGLMLDINVAPTQTAAYEQYTKAALDKYYEIANEHMSGGEINTNDPAVVSAAADAAAKLFAYACYNERTLNQYVFFADQKGDTDLGSSGSATALKQEYYLRINEQEGVTDGYRYHYTIKKVAKSEGIINASKSLFEDGRTRITTNTNLLYRLEVDGKDSIKVGDRNEILGVNMLVCNWKTGDDWGKADIEMKKGSFIEPEDIRKDIEDNATDDNHTIRANINILADNIVKDALILALETDAGEIDRYLIIMTINTEVANKDTASIKMLGHANGTSDCAWVDVEKDGEVSPGLAIAFTIWSNGLFRGYTVSENWKGKISGFSGVAESLTTYNYSYSDRDCDMTRYLEMLDEAKAAKGE